MVFHIDRCPNCSKPIHEPFSRLSGPVSYVHKLERGPRRGCRLIVIPDARGGDPTIRVVPWIHGTTLEGELEREIARFDYQTLRIAS